MIESTSLEGIKGKDVVVIDDEASGGSSLVRVAQSLKDHGAGNIYAVVTHLAGPAREVLKVKDQLFADVIVSDSLPISEKLEGSLTVLSLASEIAQHIEKLEGGPQTQLRAAFDLGSAKLKVRVALVNERQNTQSLKEEEVHRMPLARDLAERKASRFSKGMVSHLLTSLQEIKTRLDARYPNLVYQAVATEVFRKAANGGELITKIEELGIPARIIDQEKEACLGYKTAKALAVPGQGQKLLAWDHGGGSFQLSYLGDKGELVSYMGEIGSIEAARYLKSDIQGGSLGAKSYKVISKAEAELFVDGMHARLPAVPENLRQLLTQDPLVVGIGSKSSVLGIAAAMSGKASFSREELWQGIVKHLRLSASQLSQAFEGTSLDTLMPRALIAYTLMKKLGIERVLWKPSQGSTVGLLQEQDYWRN